MTERKHRILIIGGAGYVGSELCSFLVRKRYAVDVIDLLWFGNNLLPDVRVIQKDAFNCGVDDFLGYQTVFFLGGLSTDPMAEFHPALNYIYNGALPGYLAFCAKQAGVKRFIFASSCSVYGHAVDRFYQEDELVHTQYPYGIGKYQGEKGVMQLGDENFSTVVLRFGTICGHSARMRMDLVVNTMFKSALTEHRIMVNNPTIWRPICDIRDALHAYDCALEAPQAMRGVFNIASQNMTVIAIAEIVKKKVEHIHPAEIIVNNIHDLRNYRVSFEQAKNLLFYIPQYTVEDIVDNLLDHREGYGDFTNENMYNLAAFKKLFSEHDTHPAVLEMIARVGSCVT